MLASPLDVLALRSDNQAARVVTFSIGTGTARSTDARVVACTNGKSTDLMRSSANSNDFGEIPEVGPGGYTLGLEAAFHLDRVR